MPFPASDESNEELTSLKLRASCHFSTGSEKELEISTNNSVRFNSPDIHNKATGHLPGESEKKGESCFSESNKQMCSGEQGKDCTVPMFRRLPALPCRFPISRLISREVRKLSKDCPMDMIIKFAGDGCLSAGPLFISGNVQRSLPF